MVTLTRSGKNFRVLQTQVEESLFFKARDLGIPRTHIVNDALQKAVESEEERLKIEAADGGATTTTKSLPHRPVSRTSTSE